MPRHSTGPGLDRKPGKVAPRSGSFATEDGTLALDAMRATVNRLRQGLRDTSKHDAAKTVR